MTWSNTKRKRADDFLSFASHTFSFIYFCCCSLSSFCSRCSRNDWTEEKRKKIYTIVHRWNQVTRPKWRQVDDGERKCWMFFDSISSSSSRNTQWECGYIRTYCSLSIIFRLHSPSFTFLRYLSTVFTLLFWFFSIGVRIEFNVKDTLEFEFEDEDENKHNNRQI